MCIGVAKPRSEAARAIEENFTGSYEPRSRRAAVSFNALPQPPRPKCDLLHSSEAARGPRSGWRRLLGRTIYSPEYASIISSSVKMVRASGVSAL